MDEYNRVMDINELNQECLEHIEKIVWGFDSAENKLNALQNLLYQWGANMDQRSIDMFGDDDDK